MLHPQYFHNNLLMRNVTSTIFSQQILYDILLWVIIDMIKNNFSNSFKLESIITAINNLF